MTDPNAILSALPSSVTPEDLEAVAAALREHQAAAAPPPPPEPPAAEEPAPATAEPAPVTTEDPGPAAAPAGSTLAQDLLGQLNLAATVDQVTKVRDWLSTHFGITL